jgi:ribonuclease P protein component
MKNETRFRLTRTERVRRRPEFERAYDGGVRIHGHLMTVFVVANTAGQPRFGVAATKKLGPAVVRNRATRLAREVFRHHKPDAAVDVIIVPRREMLDAPFATLEADFLAALARRHRERPRPRQRTDRRRPAARPASRV